MESVGSRTFRGCPARGGLGDFPAWRQERCRSALPCRMRHGVDRVPERAPERAFLGRWPWTAAVIICTEFKYGVSTHDQPPESHLDEAMSDQDAELPASPTFATAKTPTASSTSTFVPPSIRPLPLTNGTTYSHFSPVPRALRPNTNTNDTNASAGSEKHQLRPQRIPCILGVDEAGRGPVLGPMVYGVCYVPMAKAHILSRRPHAFHDSKALTAEVRSSLMRALCTESEIPSDGVVDNPAQSARGDNGDAARGSDDDQDFIAAAIAAFNGGGNDNNNDGGGGNHDTLHNTCGWATAVISARDISSDMLQPGRPYNLNEQAMAATVGLVQGVLNRGVLVVEMYVDTIGKPEVYQRRLSARFPSIKITVSKKADAIYPVVGAASVVAKVTRDAALERLAVWLAEGGDPLSGVPGNDVPGDDDDDDDDAMDVHVPPSLPQWGSGYPSDARCVSWLKSDMDPVFGWGAETRFSWGTAKELLELTGSKSTGVRVDWPVDEEPDGSMRMTSFFAGRDDEMGDELVEWYGKKVAETVF